MFWFLHERRISITWADHAVLQKEPVGGYKIHLIEFADTPCKTTRCVFSFSFLFLDSPKALNFNEVTPMVKCKIIMKERWIFALCFYLVSLTPRLYERGVFNFCPVTKHLQTGMYERPIWVHEFSRKKKFLHGPIHP